ncbi:MAG: HAMP domain-containing protein [Armatimonadetes bacterium]|nr:HAMP domain-containing protein [Anaerolineae bacterium]
MNRLKALFDRATVANKFILLTIIMFGLLIVSFTWLFNSRFDDLVVIVSQQQLEGEIDSFQQRFEVEGALLVSGAQFLAALPGLPEAATDGTISAELTAAFREQAAAVALDHLEVFDANGNLLISTEGETPSITTDNAMYRAAAAGQPSVALIAHASERNEWLMYSTVPLLDASGTQVVGVLGAGYPLDSSFMDELDASREDIHIGLIMGDDLIATDSSEPEELEEGLEQNPAEIAQAAAGSAWISSALVDDESNTPDAVAYAPMTVGGTYAGVLQIRYEIDQLSNLQGQSFSRYTGVIGILQLIIISIAYLVIRARVTYPLQGLEKVAKQFSAGDLTQRVAVANPDEIGQVGEALNTMADQLQATFKRLEVEATEANEARRHAEQSDVVKSAFLASMSHELRTPLNAVINFTKFVANGVMGPVNEQQEETLREVIDSGKHLLNLINDVLDMSKIQSGSLKLFVEDNINVEPLIESVVATTKVLLADKPVKLELDVNRPLPRMRGDRQRILQIMLNLMSNACKFTEEGSIVLSVSQHGGELHISVRDTGPGIAIADQMLVFEPFKRTATGIRQGGGTGLGMPISRSLAEAHGGRLWLESELDKGSVFYVALPIHSEALIPTLGMTPVALLVKAVQ